MAKKTTKKATKKVAAKKSAAKKQAPVKKVAAKKVAAKKTTSVKKAAAKTVAPAKKVAPKQTTPVKKVAAKKPAVKKMLVETTITARVDVGFGNALYIRGVGAGLDWQKGVLLENVSPYEWTFKTTKAASTVSFKFLINDEVWAEGEDLTVAAGGTSISSPTFVW